MKAFYLLLSVVIFITSCKKDELDSTPEIEFISISPSQVKELSDQVEITFSYKDGDGDLGENNPDAVNLFITDNRANLEYKMRIKQLAPEGSGVAIQGTLTAVIENTGITNGSSSQEASFSLYVVDRAGNKSNTVTTASITIVK